VKRQEHPQGRGWIVTSTASLDEATDTYMGLIGRVLAAIVAIFLGATLLIAGALGIQPGTPAAPLAVAAGITLILLAFDQLWRAVRKFD
jgi:hypothetical protein